jgi:hypothetical protein
MQSYWGSAPGVLKSVVDCYVSHPRSWKDGRGNTVTAVSLKTYPQVVRVSSALDRCLDTAWAPRYAYPDSSENSTGQPLGRRMRRFVRVSKQQGKDIFHRAPPRKSCPVRSVSALTACPG